MKKSIVIPTLWRCPERLLRMLAIYQASPRVGEVLIIDNHPALRPRIDHDKVRILPQEQNIYVNPAWNLGAREARFELVLANDDIELDRLDELIAAVDACGLDLVGACNGVDDGDIVIQELAEFPVCIPEQPQYSSGFGSLMFVRDYQPIPASMRLYYGDNVLFEQARSRGMFRGLRFLNPSSTAEASSEWDAIKHADESAFLDYLDGGGAGISVSMIVRNEADCLDNCLRSVRGADEIIVVDTGSTDNTVDIARRHTGRVYEGVEYAWQDDFSRARNQALRHCRPGNWVLSIDADETLCEGGMDALRRLVAGSRERAYALRLVAEGFGHVHYPVRFFRKLPGVAWNEPIHESIAAPGAPRCEVEVTYGYSSAHQLDPGRSMRILRAAVAAQPDSPRRRFYLAREYWYAQQYEMALYHYDYYMQIGTWLPELAEGQLMKARCLWQLQRADEAREVCVLAIQMNPNFREALLFMAEMHYEPVRSRWQSFAELADNSDVLFIRT